MPAKLNAVLIAPEIPQNTGNIGRLCVNSETNLHLIRPLGFSLEESKVKRAGLDYWSDLNLHLYDCWDEFLEKRRPERMFFISTRGRRSVYDVVYEAGDYLVFGNETGGLPDDFYIRYTGSLYKIPMPGQGARSLNLANSTAIVVYEALRQINDWNK
ncbi:MAG: tRNA (cytidine(34)-2'-O)-methyltransferase [Lentisphaeria bacterium]